MSMHASYDDICGYTIWLIHGTWGCLHIQADNYVAQRTSSPNISASGPPSKSYKGRLVQPGQHQRDSFWVHKRCKHLLWLQVFAAACQAYTVAAVLLSLKITASCQATSSSHGLCIMQGEVRCEQPNASLYTFTGNLMLSPPYAPEEQTVPLSQASLLLRGSSLRNTKYVYGAVIFAGHESKVSQARSLSLSITATLHGLHYLFPSVTLCSMNAMIMHCVPV